MPASFSQRGHAGAIDVVRGAAPHRGRAVAVVSSFSGMIRIGARYKHHSAPIILPNAFWQNDGGRMMGLVGLRRVLDLGGADRKMKDRKMCSAIRK